MEIEFLACEFNLSNISAIIIIIGEMSCCCSQLRSWSFKEGAVGVMRITDLEKVC